MPALPLLIQSLLDPSVHSERPACVELRETHISWVLLTDRRAYKIKKPVDLGFVDFTTLDRRRHFCEEEVRLNRRTAAAWYEGVTAIGGTAGGPELDGSGPAIEYAVRMRRFDDRHVLANGLGDETTIRARLDRLACDVAAFHAAAEAADPNGRYGTPPVVRAAMTANFRVLLDSTLMAPRHAALQRLSAWSDDRIGQLASLIERRRREGRVRECHGDLHLGNLVDVDGRLIPFDAIEFNPDLRWIDVAAEIAFLMMDLDDHERTDLARRFLDGYLTASGDYELLPLLPLMLGYRALVRAKVDVLRSEQEGGAVERLRREAGGYVRLAERYARRRQPRLAITYGMSGSGKTSGTEGLVERGGWVRIRSDVERKRLAGRWPEAQAGGAAVERLYTPEMTAATYGRLAELAAAGLDGGWSVVVDATFLRAEQRARFRRLAERLGVPFSILPFEAPPEELARRLRLRQQRGGDASDADEAVLQRQLREVEPLDAEERRSVARTAQLERDAAG